MSTSQSDRNVLFGVLALQMEFITQAGLIAALQAWTLQKSKLLGELLVELGHMSAEDRAALEPMVDRHVAKHGGSAEQSLAALSSVSEVAAELRELNDADVQHSLGHVAAPACRQAGVLSGVIPANEPKNENAPAAAMDANESDPPPQLQPTFVQTIPEEESRPAMRFVLLRPHAEGGLGKVWIAKDRELNREVAFKEIKSNHARDKTSRGRFVLEAEITGGLEHPGIVPVYGLGHFEDGRPFYAMRFIRGRSLKEAIEQFHHKANGGRQPSGPSGVMTSGSTNQQSDACRSPDFDGRAFRNLIQRLIDVCNAIAYAHSRGVLHRDLKPGNIMLGKYGETLVVDWGLAKAKGQSFDLAASASASTIDHESKLIPTASDEVALTQMGSAIGTPKFMSPEQAAGRLDLLGPSSDIYGLGATLYELLTGQAPIGAQASGESERLTVSEVLRRVEQGEFPNPRSVLPMVPAPLEAVCLKAMSREPNARYATAQALAEDLERWLAGDPVSAWPEPVVVRARRWIKRHPTLVVSTAATVLISLVSLAAIASIIGKSNQTLAEKNQQLDGKNRELDQANTQLAQTNTQLAQANTDLENANASERTAKQDAVEKRTEAEKARDETKRAFDFLIAAFRKSDPSQDGGSLTVAELFDQATEQLEITFPDQPLIQAQLLDAIGQTYHGLGLYPKAVTAYERARDLRQKELGEDHEATLVSIRKLASAYYFAGRQTESLSLDEEALERTKAKLGLDHTESLALMKHLVIYYHSAGRIMEMLPTYEQALQQLKSKYGSQHPSTLSAMGNLADAYVLANRTTEALPLYEHLLNVSKKTLGPEHQATLSAMMGVARGYESMGRKAEALQLRNQIVELRKAKFDSAPEKTVENMSQLAFAYELIGQKLDALVVFEQILEMQKNKFGSDHPKTLDSMRELAFRYTMADKKAEAMMLLEQALPLSQSRFGHDHPTTLGFMSSLASAYASSRKPERAIPLYERTLQFEKARLGLDHPTTLFAMENLAREYKAAGRTSEALPLYEQTLELKKQKLGVDHLQTLSLMETLGSVYQSVGRSDQALPLYQQLLERKRARFGPDHRGTLDAMSRLASAYSSARKPIEAIALFEEVIDLTKSTIGADDPKTFEAMNGLAMAYGLAGRPDEAIPLFDRVLEHRRTKYGPGDQSSRLTMRNLAVTYQSAKRPIEAVAIHEQIVEITRTKFGPEHAQTLGAINDLAIAYFVSKNSEKALPLIDHIVTERRKQSQADELAFAGQLQVISFDLLRYEQYSVAETYLRECLTIREKKLPDNWLNFHTRSMLGGALAGQKKFQEAESLLVEGYSGMKDREAKIPAASKRRVPEAVQRLVDLYVAWEKPEEAEKWRMKLPKPPTTEKK